MKNKALCNKKDCFAYGDKHERDNCLLCTRSVYYKNEDDANKIFFDDMYKTKLQASGY